MASVGKYDSGKGIISKSFVTPASETPSSDSIPISPSSQAFLNEGWVRRLRAFMAWNGSALSIGSTATSITWSSTISDSDSFSLNTANDELTAVVSGLYFFSVSVRGNTISSSSTGNEMEWFVEMDSGSGWSSVSGFTGVLILDTRTLSGESQASRSVLLTLSAGDKCRVRAHQTAGSGSIEIPGQGASLLALRLPGAA